jgi:hypothetical protein
MVGKSVHRVGETVLPSSAIVPSSKTRNCTSFNQNEKTKQVSVSPDMGLTLCEIHLFTAL